MNSINTDEIEGFLGGTFHQDIDSIEEALNEFIEEVDKKWMMNLINSSELFLNSDISKDEKNNFIEENCEIYFPKIKLTPLEWFYDIIERLKEEVKNK